MEPASIPDMQMLQAEIARSINEATKRYQHALANPSAAVQPLLHPADSFFSAPSINPTSSQCVVCGAVCGSNAELCKHAELRHPTIYNTTQTSTAQPRDLSSPFASPASLPSYNPPQQKPTPSANPWNTTKPMSINASAATMQPAQGFRCVICDIGCDTDRMLQIHLLGQKHRKRAELHAAFLKVVPRFLAERISRESSNRWACNMCFTVMDGENTVLQHLESGKHTRLRDSAAHAQLASVPRPHLMTHQSAPTQQPATSTALSAALSVLKEDSVSLPPVSSLLSPSFPGFNPHFLQTPYGGALATTHSLSPSNNMPGPRASIAKHPRPPSTSIPVKQTGPSFSCSLCEVNCNSMGSLNEHLNSVRHHRKQNMIEAANQPSAHQPSAHQPSAPQPSAHQPSAHQPSAPQPSANQPSALQPSAHQPSALQPSALQPSALQPSAHQPSAHQPSGMQPQLHATDVRCEVCNVTCCGLNNYSAHLSGKLHAKKLRMNAQVPSDEVKNVAGVASAPAVPAVVPSPSASNAPHSSPGAPVILSSAHRIFSPQPERVTESGGRGSVAEQKPPGKQADKQD